jgi:SAM-dependent methyltransferase
MQPAPLELVRAAPRPGTETGKLHLGCGPFAAPGWLNCDIKRAPGVELCADLRIGLPLPTDSLDCIAAIHVLQDLAYGELAPALRELRRVLKPGGVLRLGLPDLDRALRAYLARDAAYFYVPDCDALSVGAKLVTQIVWYGSVRTPFNAEFAEEWLEAAGFRQIRRCEYRQTASPYPELASLDNRERESLFVEAVK